MTAHRSPEQAQRFLDASPRPKWTKRNGEPKPGARKGPDAVLWITEDRERGLALVRGYGVAKVLELACVLDRAQWSIMAKGFVIPSASLPDVAAMADYSNVPWRIKQVQAND